MEKTELEKLTVKKLREIALEIPEISGVHGMKKEELIAAIRKHRPDVEGSEAAEAVAPKKKVKVEVDKSELKKKIRFLKQERDKALEEKDPEALRKARKRIKMLKRKLRKVS